MGPTLMSNLKITLKTNTHYNLRKKNNVGTEKTQKNQNITSFGYHYTGATRDALRDIAGNCNVTERVSVCVPDTSLMINKCILLPG